jgi:hypothetical protein
MKMLGAERAHPASRKGSEATQRLTVDVGTSKRQSAVLRLFDDETGFWFSAHPRRNARRDKGARSDPGDGKSVGYQPLIGVGDGVATEADLFGQGARRRQRFAGFRDPADDGVTKRLIETVLRRGAWGDMGTEQIER